MLQTKPFRGRLRFCTALLASTLRLANGCERENLKVKQLVEPEYPVRARIAGIQGTVQVGVQIGIDGRVLWVHGTGADPILIEAAEKNARQWVWGPFPAKFSFPYYHEINYVFRIQGNPVEVVTEPPFVRTELPDLVEIIAPRVTGDTFVPATKPDLTPKH